jgi:hypothetical protein
MHLSLLQNNTETCIHSTLEQNYPRHVLSNSASPICFNVSLLHDNITPYEITALLMNSVCYVCEKLALPLLEEHTLRLFESRVPTKLYEPNGEEVARERGKVH